MNLQRLCSAPHVDIYFDTWNNWLYVQWQGALTLAVVQYACLEIAQCFLQHAYPRVLNSHELVTNVSSGVIPWLAKHYFPGLAMAGIEQLAWVYAPTVRGYRLAEQVLLQLPQFKVELFSSVEQATHWLQLTRPAYGNGCALLPRPTDKEELLTTTVAQFKQALSGIRVTAQRVAHA